MIARLDRSGLVDVFRRLESGQVVVLVAVFMPLLLTMLGLAGDGGLLLADRRMLQNAADSAARAGANQIDEAAYRASSGKSLVLDATKARQVAAQNLSGEYPGMSASISADQQRVIVQVSQDEPTSFLRIAHIDTLHVAATSVAQPRFGITRGNPT